MAWTVVFKKSILYRLSVDRIDSSSVSNAPHKSLRDYGLDCDNLELDIKNTVKGKNRVFFIRGS